MNTTAQFVGKRRTVLLAVLTYALVLIAAKTTGSDVGGMRYVQPASAVLLLLAGAHTKILLADAWWPPR